MYVCMSDLHEKERERAFSRSWEAFSSCCSFRSEDHSFLDVLCSTLFSDSACSVPFHYHIHLFSCQKKGLWIKDRLAFKSLFLSEISKFWVGFISEYVILFLYWVQPKREPVLFCFLLCLCVCICVCFLGCGLKIQSKRHPLLLMGQILIRRWRRWGCIR